MFGLGMGEILIILVIALIFIGPKKLPGLARGLGRGLKEFQDAAKGLTSNLGVDEVKRDIEDIKKEIPSYNEQFKDDPPHDKGEPE